MLRRRDLVPAVPDWGLIGASLLVGYGIAGTLGFGSSLGSPLTLLATPIALQEMVFAGWLTRGLDRPAVDHSPPTQPVLT